MSRNARRSTQERRAALLRLLRDGTTRVDELADVMSVSASTVRRDLEHLTSDGLVARTYGGALVPDNFRERSITESEMVRRDAKAAIAQAALRLMPRQGAVFIDAGTTCGALAELLVEAEAPQQRIVVTRGLETAVTLTASERIHVTILGGEIRSLSHGSVGPLTDLALDRLSFTIAYLGADAVRPDRGVGEPTLEETMVKERIAASAQQVVVLADSSKLRTPQTPAWARLEPEWTLITDTDAPGDLEKECDQAGVRLIRADPAAH